MTKKAKRANNDLQNIHRRTDNTMAKRKSTYNNLQNNTQKDRQYNGQKKKYKQQSTTQYTEGETIQWPKEKVHTTMYKTIHRRTDNTMADRKSTYNNLQNNTQKTKDGATRNPVKIGDEFRKGKQILFHMWHPSCYSSYKPWSFVTQIFTNG